MDDLKTILDLSGLGVAALSLVIVLYIVKKQRDNLPENNSALLKDLSDQLSNVKSNHLHTVQESLNRMENKIDEGNRRLETRLVEIATILKQKNGE